MSHHRLYVGNISHRVHPKEVEDLFRDFGEIVDFDFKDRGQQINFCFVEYRSSRAAEDAMYELNGHRLNGSPIIVEPARERKESFPRKSIRGSHGNNYSSTKSRYLSRSPSSPRVRRSRYSSISHSKHSHSRSRSSRRRGRHSPHSHTHSHSARHKDNKEKRRHRQRDYHNDNDHGHDKDNHKNKRQQSPDHSHSNSHRHHHKNEDHTHNNEINKNGTVANDDSNEKNNSDNVVHNDSDNRNENDIESKNTMQNDGLSPHLPTTTTTITNTTTILSSTNNEIEDHYDHNQPISNEL